MSRRAFVDSLARENQKFYGTSDGRGVLRAFELALEHRWTYVFELAQNALDAGARALALRIEEDGDALTFQHDGNRSLREQDVEGLSKVFRSTKGASTVGFMGIGFKSVFSRFREAGVSGWGWTFRYEITHVTGERYGDVQPDLLGAVVPIWDDAIAAPEPGFTTRFELRQRTDDRADLQADLARFLPHDDRTPLAILAASGLKRLEVNGRVWDLEVGEDPDGSWKAAAFSEGEIRHWRIFPVVFEPSREAIARFLEHRRIQPTEEDRERVYTEAARRRRVLGVLLLDDNGIPAPLARGRVYATLPTDVTLPFGLHVNADWLLNVSRSGIREIEDNAWQREIANRVADVLTMFLGWVSRTFSEPAAIQAAFEGLAPPSPDRSVIEAFFAEEGWRSRLRDLLENAAVFPVWTGEAGRLEFVKPGDAIVPPVPLAEAFAEEPDLRPSILLKGPVLMEKLLGSDALDLMEQVGLLAEISPADMGSAWPDGLKRWWRTIATERENRQRLLFRIWAAVAKLASEDGWSEVELPCIRTVTGKWLPVDGVVFFNEPLPSAREPGGSETRQLMQPFISDANRVPPKWIAVLRQGAAKETRERQRGALSQAWEWIEEHARSISLQWIVEEALGSLASLRAPDWSVLVPLGHWSKHRNRADLLPRVLVDLEGGPQGVPVEEALLAAPYVECGRHRKLLYPALPGISAAYLERDPKHADAREWRAFLEQAGAKGAVEVRCVETHVRQYEWKQVEEFLGVEVDGSNHRGYTLREFDIEPDLPEPNACEELRTALASWLEDGCNALRGKGRRKCSYFYYERRNRTGSVRSAWATKLTDLAWVPCDDGELRCPQDVLSQHDPARGGVPVARLSSDLLSVLDQEGVKFGSAIPEATPLHRLSTTGSRLDAEALAHLLRECREWVTTDEDRSTFARAARELGIPSDDGKRIPFDRIVRQVGGGERLRGALGGWIVPLDRIDETLRVELEHSDFPCRLPDTTMGHQALTYLREVWARARTSPQGLANEVRDVLPTAYAYSLEDRDEDVSLAERWEAAMPEAAVFADREWIVLAQAEEVYFDDIEDRRFFPSEVRCRTATSGHFGNDRSAQLCAAEALGLPRLSSSVTWEWHVEDEVALVPGDWASRFDLICQLLRLVRGRERSESGGTETETGAGLGLICVRELALEVRVGQSPAEHVPVNARLHEAVLTVAGRPVLFGADAAKELLRHFSFGQRGGLAADLTGMLGAIDSESDFNLAVDKFRRSHAQDFDFPAPFPSDLEKEESADTEDDPLLNGSVVESGTGGQEGEAESVRQAPSSGDSDHVQSNTSDAPAATGVRAGTTPNTSGSGESGSTGGSFTKDRALVQQNALAQKLKSSLKGEIAPEDDDASMAPRTDGEAGAYLGDKVYREVAAQYERESGRKPEIGEPHQTGWDIRSVDPETRAVRLIEVKGKGCPWVDDEVVELSRAQVRKAFESSADRTRGSWYLYVVEKANEGDYKVLPIANPVGVAAKWILSGESWRMVAEGPKRVASPST